MNKITQEQINKTLKECPWKVDVGGVDVCRGDVLPCEKLIESGRCDALIRLFTSEEEND